ncbi:MAG: TMEM175 family protein [Polyangiaceae bacterium]
MKLTFETSDAAPFATPHKRLERMVFFSDAVFAIAITLLAIEVKLPHGEHGHGNEPFTWHALDPVIPTILAWAVSFAVIGSSWRFHSRMCERFVSADAGLQWWNLVRLFFITIIPFPTAVVQSGGGTRESWMFYVFTLAVSGASELAMWIYAARKASLVGPLPEVIKRNAGLRMATSPVVFAISGLAAMHSFEAGWISLSVLMAPSHMIVGRITRKSDEAAMAPGVSVRL